MAQVSVRIDDGTKQQAERVLDELGLPMSTVINAFLKQIVREQRVPLDFRLDPFHSVENQACIQRAVKDLENGVNWHEHELVEADE